jgi:N-acetylmuramoyl-L-alanine amidase
MPVYNRHIVIDAGHGGFDPGKVAEDGTEEKGINLSIASLLAGYMRQGGAYVTMTRTEDVALSDNKREDLKKRALFARNTEADMFISIHQNSFPQGNVHGAQVFYKKDSESGKALAICIQKRLKEVADVGNTRLPKADGSYYILKNSEVPSVIVECGFLSNAEEHDKLLTEEYREHIAWAIYMGVLDYYGEGQV